MDDGASQLRKSTLASLLAAELQGRGLPVVNLDGDEVRMRLSKGLGFSKEDRDENIRRISYVARVASDMGGVAITSAISPYREIRDEARAEIAQFVEVFVSCPVEVCIQRDVKGLYKKALAGEIKGFTGIDDPYEEPLNPELVVHTDRSPSRRASTTSSARWKGSDCSPAKKPTAAPLAPPPSRTTSGNGR